LVQADAPLAIRPMLPYLTRSEIHAVMTGGFATIAGSVLAAYIIFGVSIFVSSSSSSSSVSLVTISAELQLLSSAHDFNVMSHHSAF